MIELTVKTLDSQNHAFSVPDDTTVKQLKEKIAESISFPVDSQRLIYCGRVLQDDKNLSEYDVNGKVIHLVQRPPPQASRPNGGQSGTRTGTGGQQRRGNHHFRQPRLDGNAMYLGAMAFPADLMDAQGIQAPPSSHSLSLSRLVLARKMLRRATSVLHRLENPPTQEGNEADTPPEEGETASASNGENGPSGSTVMPPILPFQGSIAQAAQAATAAAIAAAVSAAHAAGVPNITIVRGGQPQGESERVDVHIGDPVQDVADQEVTVTTTDATADTTTDTPMQDASSPPEASETQVESQGSSTDAEAGTTSTPTNSEERVQRSLEPPRTNRMAELLDELANVNRRLQPFMAQYHQLMQDDPVYEANATSVQESQRVFSLVSEIMHYLSHAYHALSDIMCDFSQPPPRSLRCRPVLIQHSAVLQAGIPIQAQINLMANRGNSNNSSNTSDQENSTRGATNGSVSATETATEAGVGSTASSTAVTPVAAASTTSPTTPSNTPAESQVQTTQQEQRSQVQLGNGQETTFNITPGNVEFFMEVGPGSITIDSLEATVVTNGNAGGMGNGGVEANVVGGSFPWGSPPPPEFIQNLMQAVAGHMIGRGVGVAQNSGTQSQPAGGAGAAAAGAATGVGTGTGQNSQARGNTATHPTTATQTRSTSRPHVHLAPAMQGLGASNFDPFLPCNSHHIRSRSRHAVHPFQQHFLANLEPPVQTQTAATTSASASNNADEGDEARATASASQQSERDSPVQSQTQSDPQTPPQPRPFVVVHAQPSLTTRSQDLPSQPQATQQQQQQQPPQPQPPQQPQQPPNEHAAQNLYDLISNMFSSLPAGAGTSINFGPLYQTVPLTPPAQSRTQSSSANTARSSSTSSGATGGPPPGMAFYMNMLNGQGPAGAAGESHPYNNIPMFAQMFEGLTGALGGALRGQGQGTTLADFLQSLPDHSYTEGSSLFIDFMMTLARSMTFQDIIALSFGSPEVVNRLRPQLREFVGQRVLQGEPMSEENISRGVDRLLRELRPYLDVMLQARLREDVDLITTTVRYNQIRLPEAIGLIMAEGNEAAFGRQMVQWCTTYIRELTAIIRHCCLDSNQGLDMIMRNYVQQLTRGVHPSIQQWTVNSSLVHMRNYISHQNVPLEDIQRFLVYRIPGGTPSPSTEDSSAPAQQIAGVAQPETVNAEVRPEPMEMDTNIGEPRATPPPPLEAEHITSTLAMDTESLPDVVLGSEAWHNVLPSEWVPIITRDTQRQRRQSTQPPFSDAYLSGMPSKRRKVVTSAKPQGNMSQIITESVRRSLEDAGVRPVSGIETAGDDLELQAAYREQMRSSVQQTLINNPDFTPDRFPNATKYFAK
ncbi:large proline-rich protein BAG6 [Anabrus simplex]|uniref:large proline-rich protein BAG6 n=1 Tax=Anabrus simplex TaxID=316456 RepID=UPI0035A29460